MSSNVPTREVALRVFAREFNDGGYTFKESDDDRAPVYMLLPTGARANRVFIVGTLTETDDVGEDAEYWRGRVVDPTGTFFVYAGQYQPDAAAFLREAEPPVYVAVVGKPRTYETDDETYASVRPESITEVDDGTRDRWVAETAARTLERIEAFDTDDEYAAMVRERYDTTLSTYREQVITALEGLETETETETKTETKTETETETKTETETETETETKTETETENEEEGVPAQQ